MATCGWGNKTMEYGLIGEKLGHSYSKLIQEKLLDHYEYELHPLKKEEVDSFMREKAFKAINVTIPYKQTVIPYLDTMDQASQKIGAVNTIVNEDGKLIGHNTDYYGFDYMLKHHHIAIRDKKVLVMGNGGASKAIQAVVSDHQAKTMLVVDVIKSEGVLSIEEVYAKHSDVDVIINTTPLGMYPNIDGCAVDFDKFKHVSACLDVVYNPFITEFALQAKKRGIQAVTGLEMLVAQAKYALEFFKNITIDDREIDRIYKEILLTTTNIVLADKQYAQAVAEMTNKQLIFIEDECAIHELSKKTNVVIVCKANSEQAMDDLKRNGFFIHNTSSVEEIIMEYKAIIENL
ncbi:MAG: shikimate dehydrogenase [Erysipelotrichia bacterium]|nr:shikimate dehydrogenase [Erysipelotrichia bacterium]NCC54340.1 shikimate dehydrogenase [Erysipelotrichia bacterium]